MAQKIGPNSVVGGLVASLDVANTKCFKGGVTSNLLNSATNSYPKVGNTWGTYNTNQYNNGSFFSIGTVSAVTNNVVTTSAAHPLRTYDVIRPQTTGGGVTANTDYFVKKLSDTTFSLYAYDSNQDGTNGWATRAAIVNDSKVSINSTSFPTMWWGAPHLPNSGLVKTIVKNALNGHECVRFNFDRSDGIDAMAYGGDTPTLSNGVTYTYSFWYRAANDAAIGKTIAWSIYYTATTTNGDLGTTNPFTRKWQRHTATLTAPANTNIYLYWWPSTGGATCAMDVSEIQIESGSAATPFTPTSRGTSVSTGGGLYDLSGNLNHGTLNNSPVAGTDFGGSLILNGTNQYVSITPTANTIRTYDATVVFAVKLPLYSGGQRCILSYRGGGVGGQLYIGKGGGGIFCYYDSLNNPGHTVGSIADGAPVIVAVVLNASGTTISTYINGSLAGSATRTGWVSTYNTVLNLGYDAGGTNEYMTGSLYYYAHYNRVLSSDEVKSVYNLLRPRLKL